MLFVGENCLRPVRSEEHSGMEEVQMEMTTVRGFILIGISNLLDITTDHMFPYV